MCFIISILKLVVEFSTEFSEVWQYNLHLMGYSLILVFAEFEMTYP